MVAVRAALAYGVMCTIWGTTWLAIKVALTGFPPLPGAGIRFVVAALFLYACVPFVERVGEAPSWHLVVVLATTLFGLNYALTYYAETRLASGLVAVLFGTLPFFVFAFGALMVGERVALRVVGGALLALAGVAAIFVSGPGGEPLAIAATLLASALSAFANVYLKRYAAADPLRALPPAMLLAGVVLMLAGVLAQPFPLAAAVAPAPIVATLYLGIVGSAIAFFLNHWLLQRLETWVVGLSALVIPVIAVAVGALFGGETFGLRELFGAALVVAGISLALVPAQHPAARARRQRETEVPSCAR